ncbi:isopentenyl-diphosphate Delta-isomerase [Rhodoplanes serenus]|uniref:isopentenyl-diphosphate Delta-isomerase n=1 Tax=Rhodoplanes serenus TaxID=200615 RepID=UPI000DAB3D63|nr:isopentenyl-diphosphate Delta-isomerase [Rhodoplanes serenus]MBI5114732.1 isopentenyl-diphosphate Delta-isomerase [Rhodovulum sp.]RAI32516.1 isopentenyl-diphosphate delta-isomerase [Rhodoplanes serenus]
MPADVIAEREIEEQIILVDADDRPVGTAGKTEVHRRGLPHRAISVLVRNRQGDILVQRRNPAKYHSGGLWANTCCSHPRPGETTLAAAQRRLPEEMGFTCPLQPLFTTHYRATLENGFIEDELVHVFGGIWDGPVAPAPDEVSEFAWVPFDRLAADQAAHPDAYAVWFRHYLVRHHDEIAAWLARAV